MLEFPIDPEAFSFQSSAAAIGDLSPAEVEAVRSAIDGLPKLQRAVINAFFYERLDLEGGVSKLAREHKVTRWFIYKALGEAQEALRCALAPLRVDE